MSPTGRILLFRGRGILSGIIRWQSRSKYSHAAIQLRDGSIIEAWQFAGVRHKWVRDWRDIDAFAISNTTPHDWHRIESFAQEQVGKPYDYRGVASFVFRTRPEQNQRWFCSELVYRSLERAGIELLNRTSAAYVSPGMLSLSNRLVRSTALARSHDAHR